MENKKSDYGEGTEYAEGEQAMTRDTEYNLASENDQLHRGLKSRHIQFLALGMT